MSFLLKLLWHYGTRVLWHGTMALWRQGTMAWHNGTALWCQGTMARHYGTMVLENYGTKTL